MSRIKKVLLILVSLYGAYIFATYIYFSAQPVSADYCPVALPGYKQPSLEDPDDLKHTYKLINDASCLNETRVYDVVVVKTVDDIAQAIA
ncbi:MAG TPA: hypothetical protein VLG71_02815, partial [Candidatus Limnocylindria bacterium]|nr:hypothetical protein [Candidatus Limnocylindria bacterium]